MKDIENLKTKVKEKYIELQKRAKEVYGNGYTFDTIIIYEIKSSRVLGTYSSFKNAISLNLGLLKEFGEKYIDDVFVHEFCHLVVDRLYPSGINGCKRVMPHGKEFKNVSKFFGCDGKASTTLFNKSKTLEKIRKKSNRKVFVYKCNCQEHEVGLAMHKKISSGVKYTCKLCKSRISSDKYLAV